ncbi:flavin-containing monooxygenase [Naumannella halotolerans]|uniref:Cation diffusion facilitator CzcD-associated flavoprotein CzcO n=1 Tax=Naumannella halotolerans TaxID=993414 RepID=A0A4R7JB19_9ACTN|nr:NAD(P)/FAD-dependent oxidoreductase [Naumannella halotolerans]TDT33837.1 cation diffusion facilitator CzcD-associated flavoprotein CzcO [Naumannella halotolerans]
MSADRVPVVIIGAGFAGIALAMQLQRSGWDSFVIIERGDSVGGTWRDNHYPGVACDVPSHLYALRDHPNPDWSSMFAPGAEIHRYLRAVVDEEGLGERLRLQTTMSAARWCTDHWQLTLNSADGRVSELRADNLVLACGRLTEPRLPEVPGLDSFAGPWFHTARWDHRIDLTDARVGLVGTGASAVQLLPELVRAGSRVLLYQRSAAWIMPRQGRDYSPTERRRFAAGNGVLERTRERLLVEGEERFASRSGDPVAAGAAAEVAREHLRSQVADAELRAALTPDHAFGCKRVLLSDEFYPAVASDRVELVSSALAGVDRSSLIAADGSRRDCDVLVLATGFWTTRQPYAELVVGEQERSLADHWASGMTAFASTVVSGFPNLFVLNGPNASLGHNSSVLMAEEQAGYVSRTLHRFPGVRRVRPSAEDAWTREIAIAAVDTPWLRGGCRNWYVDERSGRLTLLWPGTIDDFHRRLQAADGSEFDQLPRGRFSPTASMVP